ncbi:hypothetical protein [Klebsiella aerogenes]|uniref:hypothetical protein n=1 Tax=Klebsiella aerogenes TaxID=548 RepID=UPI001CC3E024|nr:hypothetical protein [Klebsiella aerogenes]UNX66896.1 hypothetical protein MQE04_18210 [Klebsiella aerogenes]HCR0680442.1 hypothetical protein [Klebsiella aerogenes]
MKKLSILLLVCACVSATAHAKGLDERSTWNGECEKGIKFSAVYGVKSESGKITSSYMATLTQNGRQLATEIDNMPMDMAKMPNGNTVLNFYMQAGDEGKFYEVVAVMDLENYPKGSGVVINGLNPGNPGFVLANCTFTQ